eukprot:3734522-Amphidinium_carterae.2
MSFRHNSSMMIPVPCMAPQRVNSCNQKLHVSKRARCPLHKSGTGMHSTLDSQLRPQVMKR